MEEQQRVWRSLFIVCIIVYSAVARPCGSGSFCSCFGEINLITCAAKGLTTVPEMSMINRLMCKILILDHNDISSLDNFKLGEWPQLQEIRLRNNPADLCDWINALILESNGKLLVEHDCVDETTEMSPRSKPVSVHTSTIPSTRKTTKGTTKLIETTTPEKKSVMPITETKKEVGHAHHDCVESDNIPGLTTSQIVEKETVETSTLMQSENTTSVQGWGIDLNMSRDNLAIIISVPISIFGLGIIILVKFMWKRNSGRSLSFDVRPRYRSEGNTHEQMEMTGKMRISPTPSMESVDSDVMFDRIALRRNSAIINHRSSLAGNYLNICHIF